MADEQVGRRGPEITPRLVVAVVLLVLVAAFVLDNTDDVRVGYVFGSADVPLILAFLGVLVVGLVVGYIAARLNRPGRG